MLGGGIHRMVSRLVGGRGRIVTVAVPQYARHTSPHATTLGQSQLPLCRYFHARGEILVHLPSGIGRRLLVVLFSWQGASR